MKRAVVFLSVVLLLLFFLSGCATTGGSAPKYVIHYDQDYCDFTINPKPGQNEHIGSKLWQLDGGSWNESSGNMIRVHNKRDGDHLIIVQISYLDYNNIIVRKDTLLIPVYMSTSKYDRKASEKFVKKEKGSISVNLLGLVADALTPMIQPKGEVPIDTTHSDCIRGPGLRALGKDALGWDQGPNGDCVWEPYTIPYEQLSKEFKVGPKQKIGEIVGDMLWQLDSGRLNKITNEKFVLRNARDGSHLLSVWINYLNKNGVLVRKQVILIKLKMPVDKWDD